MPKVIDLKARREEIARAAIAVIAREGMARATIRGIAREGGFSSGVVAHYFRDKDELICFAFDFTADEALGTMDAIAHRPIDGLTRLLDVLLHMLPRDDDPTTVISIAFWDSAVNNPRLMKVFSAIYARWRELCRFCLDDAVREGAVRDDVDAEVEISRLIATVDGLCVAITLDPESHPSTQREQILAASIAPLRRAPATSRRVAARR